MAVLVFYFPFFRFCADKNENRQLFAGGSDPS